MRPESGASRSAGRAEYRLGVRGGCPTGAYGGARIIVTSRGGACYFSDHA